MSLEAEQALASAMLTNPAAYEQVVEYLVPDDFVNTRMHLVFKFVDAMRVLGKPCDLITISVMLEASPQWDSDVEGEPFEFLNMLTTAARAYVVIESYITIIRNAKASRKLHEHASSVAMIAQDGDIPADDMYGLALASADLMLVEEKATDGFVGYEELTTKAVKEIVERKKRGGGLSGYSTGFDYLDGALGGFNRGSLIILAARPAMGKTTLALNIANHMAISGKVMLFSLEMPSTELTQRSLSSVGRINLTDLREANLDTPALERLKAARKSLGSRSMHIDDRGGVHVDRLAMQCRIAARKEKPQMIVIDYLTLLKGTGQNRTQEIGYVSRALKSLAKELDVPVLCLAQLNRGLESRPDKRPMLSDLRDSGEIEQDADAVLFLYRDEEYDKESEHNKGWAELIVAKNRHGATTKLHYNWNGGLQTFTESDIPSPLPPKDEKPASRGRLRSVVGDKAT